MTKSFTVEQLRCLELARIIREGLEGVEFDMGTYRNWCGTAGCIAGYAVAKYEPAIWGKANAGDPHIPAVAKKLLGLDSTAKRTLFRETEGRATLDNINPAMAAATLENYAMTGKVEWPQT